MTISEIIGQGFHYARTCKSLWLFGFFVGIASGGSGGGGGGGRPGGGVGDVAGIGGGGGLTVGVGPFAFSVGEIWPLVILLVLAAIAVFVMRFVSEGALIEGIVKARQGGTMTTREGFRAGWAHWGVLLRIGVIYVAAVVGTLALIAAPCVIVLHTLGVIGVIAFAIPALLIAVPWLVTLYLVQAFASRIAVLENRHALDAIRKARLFLHGRLMHGLRLVVATLAGTILFAVIGFVVIVPVLLLLIALIPVLQAMPVIIVGCVVLLPVVYVLAAMVGTFRSSIWTIGYVTQVES
jgi:hypothetical protein